MKQVIVTSYLFPSCRFSLQRLERISSVVGKEKLVIDIRFAVSFHFELLLSDLISCRQKGNKWYIAMNKWQDLTDMEVTRGISIFHTCIKKFEMTQSLESLELLSRYCRYRYISVFRWFV